MFNSIITNWALLIKIDIFVMFTRFENTAYTGDQPVTQAIGEGREQYE